MSPITTHVLDIARGTPARGIVVVLDVPDGVDLWTELARGTTGDDGRVTEFDPPLRMHMLRPGIYRLRFATGDYFAVRRTPTFYPEVVVAVRIDDPAEHYHIPLLLSPFGYSTYRGA
jgi:5-hydroxyisourate hydrolase